MTAVIEERPAGGYELHLAGFAVSQIIIDFAFSLLLMPPDQHENQHDTLLKIECPFTASLGGSITRFEPGDDTLGLGSALVLFQRIVDEAEIEADGSLRITFEGRDTLRVPSDPAYEAWSLNQQDGVLIIDGPGGLISVFPPMDRSKSP